MVASHYSACGKDKTTSALSVVNPSTRNNRGELLIEMSMERRSTSYSMTNVEGANYKSIIL